MASSLHPLPNPYLYKPNTQIHPLRLSPAITIPCRRSLHLTPLRFICRGGSSSTTSLERAEEKKAKAKGKRGNVLIRVRLDHQVAFGENVAIIGSIKALGSWKKKVPMEWTKDGWVCDLQLRAGETAEYKFIVLSGGDKNKVWENGNNRVLKIPDRGGVYAMVCHWDKTDEVVDLLGPVEDEDDEELDSRGGQDEGGGVVLEGESSLFVEQWQGREISFMRSNEHGSRERERRWDTSGLEGMPLKLVEGDRAARNWWRKVHLQSVSR